MVRKRKTDKSDPKGRRLQLHPCHLQGMPGDSFVRVANLVLRGQLTLLDHRDRPSTQTAAGVAAN
jgi:hypothetical protein